MAGIVVAFVERLAERDELDLDACGEFLVLIAALLELKARHLFPDEEAELAELEPEEAAEELARRLAEYRRMKLASAWLRERLEEERGALLPASARRRSLPSPNGGSPPRSRCAWSRPCARSQPSRRMSRSRTWRSDFPGRPVRGAFSRAPAASPPLRLRLRGAGALAGRAGGCIPRAARVAQGRRDRDLPGCTLRPDQDFPEPTTKGSCSGPPAPPDLDQPRRRARPHCRGAARRRLPAADAR